MSKGFLFAILCAFAVASTSPAIAGGWKGGHKGGGQHKVTLKHNAGPHGKVVKITVAKPAVHAHKHNHGDKVVRHRGGKKK